MAEVSEVSVTERALVILETALAERNNQSKNWFWTLKASTIPKEELFYKLEQKCVKFVFQLEKGPQGGEQGYVHYQGHMTLKERERRTAIKKWLPNEIHLEFRRSEKGSDRYCSKSDSWVEGPWMKGYEVPKEKRPLKLLVELREWQQQVVDICDSVADDRTVWWFWSKVGMVGKTSIVKYVCAKMGNKALLVGGGEKDVLHACTEMKETLEVVFWNTCKDDTEISYKTIEKLKDGLWFSGKYESGMTNINPVHVIVFSNRPPQLDKLSEDRWKIVKLD